MHARQMPILAALLAAALTVAPAVAEIPRNQPLPDAAARARATRSQRAGTARSLNPGASAPSLAPAVPPVPASPGGARLEGKKPTGHPATRTPDAIIGGVSGRLEALARQRGSRTPGSDLRFLRTPQAVTDMSALRSANGGPVDLVWDEELETPRLLAGRRLSTPDIEAAGDPAGVALTFLTSHGALWGVEDAGSEFRLSRTERDRAGFTAVRFTQEWQGHPVWGRDMVIRLDPEGRVIGMSGSLVPSPSRAPRAAALGAGAAAEAARSVLLSRHGVNAGVESNRLVILPRPGDDRLAWQVVLSAGLDFRREVLIDAVDGGTLRETSLVQEDGPAAGSGLDLQNQSRPLGLYQIGSDFFMTDTRKEMFNSTQSQFPNQPVGTITLLNASNGDGDPLSHLTSGNANSWNSFKNGVSGAFFASHVYDYYRTRHDRNSIDGNGGTMWLVVNFKTGFNNAFWNGRFMVFGNGDGSEFSDLAGALDVTAHEMSHGVIENTANLIYENQSGALNEHFADVFGAATEFFIEGAGGNWLLGEDVTTPGISGDALRNMENPAASNVAFGGQQPAHMDQFRNLTLDQDNGGVHINSGIPNRAFYLASTAAGMSVEKSERIWYRALSQYLVRNSEFIDFRLACIHAAQDLFGAGSAEVNAVGAAMDQVGLEDASGTPPPAPLPDNSGSDLIAVINSGDNHVLVVPPNFQVDPVDFSQSSIGPGGRPSFSDDGGVMAWVRDDQNIYLRVDNQIFQLTTDAAWWSVALSPDGNFLTATTVAEDGDMYLFDLVNEQIGVAHLTSQNSTSGDVEDVIVFADVMEWTVDGQYVVYDALHRATVQGQTFEFWDINALRLADGESYRVFQPLPQGESIGNPALAQNSDNRMAFDYVSLDGNIYVVAADFQSGVGGVVTNNLGSTGRPTFSGNDQVIYYQYLQSGDPDKIFTVSLAADGVTGMGDDAIWATDGYAPVWYTVGQRPTPVELLSLSAAWTSDQVSLDWRLADAADAAGFHVERLAAAGGDWERRTARPISSRAAGPDGRFHFEDSAPAGATHLWYRLVAIERTGTLRELGRIEVKPTAADAGALAFRAASPNPFRSRTTLNLVLPGGPPDPLNLTVYDALGRPVARLLDGVHLEPGALSLPWSARGDDGRDLPGGVYFARLTRGTRVEVQRLVITP